LGKRRVAFIPRSTRPGFFGIPDFSRWDASTVIAGV
jgi:hypothetical protein